MNEQEKMLAGELYNSFSKEISDSFLRANRLIKKFNLLDISEVTERTHILHELLGHAGKNLSMVGPIYLDHGKNTYIGDNCFFNYNTTILDAAEVHFGDNVFVGPNVSFLTPLHPLIATQRNLKVNRDGDPYTIEYAKPIHIGNNVWIAAGVTINPGVTIGDNSVIGSGSVVTRDIPSGVLAVGVPCRVIRKITDKDLMKEI